MANIGDIAEKQSTSVNRPESGSYGEKADLARLQAQLPQPGAPIGSGPQAPMPAVQSAPVRPSGQQGSPVPGLPAQLFTQPTARPSEPVTAGPTALPQRPSVNGQQERLRILDALANDPGRTPETRAWASMMLQLLVG